MSIMTLICFINRSNTWGNAVILLRGFQVAAGVQGGRYEGVMESIGRQHAVGIDFGFAPLPFRLLPLFQKPFEIPIQRIVGQQGACGEFGDPAAVFMRVYGHC